MKKTVMIQFDASEGVPVKAEVEIEITAEDLGLPALPTVNGDYKLVVLDGVYTWVAIL